MLVQELVQDVWPTLIADSFSLCLLERTRENRGWPACMRPRLEPRSLEPSAALGIGGNMMPTSISKRQVAEHCDSSQRRTLRLQQTALALGRIVEASPTTAVDIESHVKRHSRSTPYRVRRQDGRPDAGPDLWPGILHQITHPRSFVRETGSGGTPGHITPAKPKLEESSTQQHALLDHPDHLVAHRVMDSGGASLKSLARADRCFVSVV